jgi:hypothetical protein
MVRPKLGAVAAWTTLGVMLVACAAACSAGEVATSGNKPNGKGSSSSGGASSSGGQEGGDYEPLDDEGAGGSGTGGDGGASAPDDGAPASNDCTFSWWNQKGVFVPGQPEDKNGTCIGRCKNGYLDPNKLYYVVRSKNGTPESIVSTTGCSISNNQTFDRTKGFQCDELPDVGAAHGPLVQALLGAMCFVPPEGK